jgi:hypothetical protein
MDDREFTKLSLLAAAIVSDPARFEESLRVIEGEEPEIQLESQSKELEEALGALKSTWAEIAPRDRDPTTNDVVKLGEALDSNEAPIAKLTGQILLTVAQRQLLKEQETAPTGTAETLRTGESPL